MLKLLPEHCADELGVVAVLVVEQPAGRVDVHLNLVTLHQFKQNVLAYHCATLEWGNFEQCSINVIILWFHFRMIFFSNQNKKSNSVVLTFLPTIVFDLKKKKV